MEDIGLRRPSLDDVFLRLTGHGTAPDAEDHQAAEYRDPGRRGPDHHGTEDRGTEDHGTENHDSAEVAAA